MISSPDAPFGSDVAAVAAQLGRPPRGSWSVAHRCRCGLPLVIETGPHLDDGTPFPTLWWLTCKSLSKAVGRLEAGGWMTAFNERLRTDPSLAAALAASTARYVERRDARGPGGRPLGPTRHPGGGGMTGPGQGGRVKCLHAHTAHQLMTGDNPVGAAVLEQLGWVEPTERCV